LGFFLSMDFDLWVALRNFTFGHESPWIRTPRDSATYFILALKSIFKKSRVAGVHVIGRMWFRQGNQPHPTDFGRMRWKATSAGTTPLKKWPFQFTALWEIFLWGGGGVLNWLLTNFIWKWFTNELFYNYLTSFQGRLQPPYLSLLCIRHWSVGFAH